MRTKLIGAALLAAMSSTALAGGNLVTNGSFETPGPGFVLFQGWENYGNVFADMSDEVAAQEGMTSVKMFGGFPGPGIQSDSVLLQTVPGIAAGTTYTLTGYAFENSADPIGDGNLLILQLAFRDAGGNNLEVIDQIVLENGAAVDQWNQYEITAIAPPNTTQAAVVLLHLQLDGTSPGASYWDNISLTEGGGSGCNNPADFNGDGVLNFFDISEFIGAFNQGC
jgi:hypothetical protein